MRKISKKRKVSWITITSGTAMFILLYALFTTHWFQMQATHAEQIMVCPTSDPHQSLQLKPCYPITTTPFPTTATPYSPPDAPKVPGSDCTETRMLLCGTCETVIGADPANITKLKNAGCGYLPTDPGFAQNYGKPGCVDECIGKPVIYLYPQKTTSVDVTLNIPGIVTVSDPLYPANGWKHIEAHPDGTLKYSGKTYKELYYETALTTKSPQPSQGVVIPTAELKTQLTTITTQLGLLPSEQQEFLDYWLPRLNALQSPYIFFSILDPNEKERVDRVTLSPQPDTWIAFIAYFKPLAAPIFVDPLSLPQEPPQRKGFTAVEWGGTIVTN